MSGERNKSKKGANGGPSTLRKMLKLQHPSLSIKDASNLILKAREQHGGSLSGMKMGKILKSIKVLIMKEKKCQNKDNQIDKKKENDKSITDKKEDHEKNAGNDKTENNIKDDDDEAFEKLASSVSRCFFTESRKESIWLKHMDILTVVVQKKFVNRKSREVWYKIVQKISARFVTRCSCILLPLTDTCRSMKIQISLSVNSAIKVLAGRIS